MLGFFDVRQSAFNETKIIGYKRGEQGACGNLESYYYIDLFIEGAGRIRLNYSKNVGDWETDMLRLDKVLFTNRRTMEEV